MSNDTKKANEDTKTNDEVAVPPPPPRFDTTNRFMVTATGLPGAENSRVMIMGIGGMHTYTKLEALSLVAWVAVMGGLKVSEIADAMGAVESC